MIETVELFLFRHGETDWNFEKRFQGQTDIPLNEMGRQQAYELVEKVKPLKLQALLSSDLKRAIETAEIINKNLNLPIWITEKLRESHLGEAEGLLYQEVLTKFKGQISLEAWLSVDSSSLDFRFPSGESKIDVINRCVEYLKDFIKKHPEFHRIGVSTHGGFIRRLVHFCKGAPLTPVPIENCGVHQILYKKENDQWEFPLVSG